MGAVESLQIYPDSYINTTNNTLVLHIKNTGSATAVIYKVEIVGLGTVSLGTDASLTPGNETTLELSHGYKVTAGTNYQVKIYTKAGNVYSATVKAS